MCPRDGHVSPRVYAGTTLRRSLRRDVHRTRRVALRLKCAGPMHKVAGGAEVVDGPWPRYFTGMCPRVRRYDATAIAAEMTGRSVASRPSHSGEEAGHARGCCRCSGCRLSRARQVRGRIVRAAARPSGKRTRVRPCGSTGARSSATRQIAVRVLFALRGAVCI